MPVDSTAQFLSTLPFRVDPFQAEALRAISEGRSVLVAAPTGTGKTVVAEFAVHLALSRGLRAMYTTPIKALSNQKFRDFRARYGDRVGLLTGDLVENPDGRLLVMTTEVARNMLVQRSGSFQDVGWLIFDEVHYLADPDRGTAWEESILLAPAFVQLVCLSATVANAAEVADWIRTTGRDVALVESFKRAVPLKHRYYLDGALHPLLEGAGHLRVAPMPASEDRNGRARPGSNGRHGRPRGGEAELPTEPPRVVRTLAEADLLPAIYFLFSRRAVEEAAESCQRLSLLSPAESREVRSRIRDRLADLPLEDRSLAQVQRLLALLPRGVGLHHAGLLPPLKTLVEELLASGRLKVVFATDTLALGINVPARSVVLGEMVKFDGQSRRLLSPGEYRQLTGRAGRRGMDSVGYSVLLHSPFVGLDRTLEIATGEVAPLESAFRPGYGTVLSLWRGPGEEDRLAQLIAGSLRQHQESGKLRELAAERDRVLGALQDLPGDCSVCGDPARWLGQERQLKREQERAEASLRAAVRERSALEERAAAWPWQYTRSQRKQWLQAAPPGALVFSHSRGWLVYLGPSSEGIGVFFSGSEMVHPASYSDLGYLPDPPVILELPPTVARRANLLDGACDLDPQETAELAAAMSRENLPDLEAAARDAQAAARQAIAPTLREVEQRIAACEARSREASLALAHNPFRDCPHRAEHRRTDRDRRHCEGLLAALERDLAAARREASRRAHRTLRSLRSILESFGYMVAGRPTRKAAVLMRLFDSNSLVIAELLDWGVLADASAAEVAEVASWFAFDREGSGRALAITERLARMRAAAEVTAKSVVEAERRFGLDLSHPLPADFRGIALAWATGASLADLSARSGLAEGDIVFALQKTIDLCRQISQAAAYSRAPALSRCASEAAHLLRRGVVDSYYRWVVDTTSMPSEGNRLSKL